ncbi:MAG TPA: glycerol kinase GlpK [Propionibacteriaceae bacterium]
MNVRYVAAIDQGTTSTRCILFDRAGRLVSIAQREHTQHFPNPGWVEHDALEIWRNTGAVVKEALRRAGATYADVAAVGLANQRETVVIWDPSTGQPVTPAVTWQDTRTAVLAEELRTAGEVGRVEELTGLKPEAYYAGPRLRWLLDHTPGLRDRAERGEVIGGTMDSWLIWNLTGGPAGGRHVCDVTNASRTLLMDITTCAWHPELLDLLAVPRALLPEIVPSIADHGTCTSVLPGIMIGAALGDQQAALFGHTCFSPGEAKCTLGSGGFVLMNTGDTQVHSTHGMITTVGYQLAGRPVVYALEGSIAVTGSLVQWLRDGLKLIRYPAEVETLALTVPDNGGCYVVPAFAGLYTPHWRSEARGVIAGLTSFINRGHLARAVLEATAWQTLEVLEAMEADTGIRLPALRVDGGMTANNLLMQLLADIIAVPVERQMVAETVSLGAAFGAGVAAGFWSGPPDLPRDPTPAGRWTPGLAEDDRAKHRGRWRRAVQSAMLWGPDGEAN